MYIDDGAAGAVAPPPPPHNTQTRFGAENSC